LDIENISLNHLSASKLNKFIECPLKFYYLYIIGANKPDNEVDGFDASKSGTLMHECFELFGKHIKDNPTLSDDQLSQVMYDISLEAYRDIVQKEKEENIYHKLQLKELQAGLIDSSEHKGLLARFIEYFKLHREEFDNFQESEFEREFFLDKNLKLTNNSEEYFIKGFIDRVDNLDEVTIIDYKSSKVQNSGKDSSRQMKVEELKDVQLPLYMLWAEQQYRDKEITSSLLSFKKSSMDKELFTGKKWGAHFVNISTKNGAAQTHYNEDYRENLISKIEEIKELIESGNFGMTPSKDSCQYCDIQNFCFGRVEKDEEK
jgi:ATP-dependent helicase/DNAse subunit B